MTSNQWPEEQGHSGREGKGNIRTKRQPMPENETEDFINLLRNVPRNVIVKEDIYTIAIEMKKNGYTRDASLYLSKFQEMKRNHPNPNVCKAINDIVAKEKAYKESTTRLDLYSDDDDHGSGDVNDQEADEIKNNFPSTFSPVPENYLDIKLEEGNHPINTAKKQKTATSLQSSFGQNPQGTNSPGASTSTNLKRRSGQESKISSDKSDVILEKLLEEKNWDKIKMFLEICPSLSQHWVTIIGKLALDEGQMDVVKICFLKMGEGESLDEPHNQE